MNPEDVVTWLEGKPKRPKRLEVARYYRDLLIEHRPNVMGVDWVPLNTAIRNRWSDSGLQWIKQEAWRMAAALAPETPDRKAT